MPLDHILTSVPVDKYDDVVSFYKNALKPMNYEVRMDFGKVIGLGSSDSGSSRRMDFWIAASDGPSTKMHLAFTAKDHGMVDAFHAAAIAAGGQCNGPPGIRPMYHSTYYGAFVMDPIGNNIEAVHRND